APIDAGGRADLGRAALLDPSLLAPTPTPGASFAALPDAMQKKSIVQGLERALRDHALCSIEVSVDVHADLALARGTDEAPEAFLARCRAAAARKAEADVQEVEQRFAPKLAKLRDRLATAQQKQSESESAATAAPGVVGTAIIGLVGGRGIAKRLESQQRK